MKTALVVVEFPYGAGQQIEADRARYLTFLDEAEKRAKTAKGIDMLDRNVWLIDVRDGQQFLAWLVATTTELRRPVRVLYLDHGHEEWIRL